MFEFLLGVKHRTTLWAFLLLQREEDNIVLNCRLNNLCLLELSWITVVASVAAAASTVLVPNSCLCCFDFRYVKLSDHDGFFHLQHHGQRLKPCKAVKVVLFQSAFLTW